MNRAVVTSLVSAALLLCAGPAQSHHSNVEYEVTKVITVTGVVTEFEWVNPHTWLHITVDMSPAKDGTHKAIIARVTKADGTILSNQPVLQ